MKAAIAILIVLCLPWIAMGQESPASAAAPPDSLNRNYSDELPRVPPLSRQEALASFRVAKGFTIQEVTGEPLVMDPVAMAFDEDGRLYVVEMRGYSENETEKLGRVRLLEDQDGDGQYEKSSIFLDQLSWPTAIACYQGGVLVGVAPDILYAKDTDGDRKADVKEVVFTGFHRSNVQGLLNSFTWGLDNRIHGATSGSGGEVRAVAEPEAQPLVLRNRDFAIEPRQMSIAPTTGGGQHGLSFDRWGHKFVCSNSDHIQLVMFLDRYAARNPYAKSPPPRISIAADGPQADVFRTSPVEPWRIVRTRLRKQGIVPGPVEGGGRAAGYFTSATGITIYEGDAWPSQYYGFAIVGDVGGNLIHRKRLQRTGLSHVAHRVDERSEFVTSSDIWFRPVQFANAPDGTLFVADMYREVIEHPASLHPVIKQHLDLTSGRDRGRIYRIIPEGFAQPKLPRLSEASTAELVALLDHPNTWQRSTAARLLYERQDSVAVPILERLSTSAVRPEGKIRALYALDGLNALSPEVIIAALADKHPFVRVHGVRLAEQLVGQWPLVRERLYQLIDDDDPSVRYQLAFSLGQLPSNPRRNQALAALALLDGEDPYARFAVHSSLKEGAGAVLEELAREEGFSRSENGRVWLELIAAQIGRQQRPDDLALVIGLLRDLSQERPAVARIILDGLGAKQGTALEQQLAAATGGASEKLLEQLLADARQTALDPERDAEQRAAAVHQLRLANFQAVQDVLEQLLQPNQPTLLQQAALSTLASFTDEEIGQLLIQQWPSLSPAVRAQASDVLVSRVPWLLALLDALEQKRIATGDLQPGRLQVLAQHQDNRVRQRAKQLLEHLGVGSRAEVVQAYEDVLERPGDAQRGKEVFRRACASCHQVENVGHAIAPNIVSMRNRGPEAILVNVLDPNREVNPEYLNYIVLTTDGRTLSGMIAAETATAIQLKRADNAVDQVLRTDIEQMRSTGMSLMPEGLEKDVDRQALADLIAYLMSVE